MIVDVVPTLVVRIPLIVESPRTEDSLFVAVVEVIAEAALAEDWLHLMEVATAGFGPIERRVSPRNKEILIQGINRVQKIMILLWSPSYIFFYFEIYSSGNLNVKIIKNTRLSGNYVIPDLKLLHELLKTKGDLPGPFNTVVYILGSAFTGFSDVDLSIADSWELNINA